MTTKPTSPGSSHAPVAELLLPGPIIFVIGPPGSGKGTLCSRLCRQNPGSLRHLSVGDYLRELCSTGGLQGLPPRHGRLPPGEIERYLRESRLLPPGTVVPLIRAGLAAGKPPPGAGWLVDGFPRDIETARAFEKEIKPPARVIVLHCDLGTAQDRFLGRRRAETDDKALFDKRMAEYDEKSRAVFEHYRDIITNVHTSGDKDECWKSLVQALRVLPEFKELHLG